MRRTLVSALFLVVSACGDAPAVETTAGTAATTIAPNAATEAVTTTIPSGNAGATSTTPLVRPDGEDAPDFSLALGEGGTFILSEETRPVFLLFWAEW
jgi:hypothetical protein